MELQQKKSSPVKWVHTVLVFVFMFGFGYLPAVGGITPVGIQVLGVFIGCLWGWIFVGALGWPSLLGIIAFGVTDYADMSTILASAFGSQTAIMIFCMMLVIAYVNQAGLADIIVNYMLTRKFIEGKPWMIVFMFLLSSFVASIFSVCTICAILFIELFRQLMKNTDIKPYGPQVPVFLAGISLATVLSEIALPFKSGAIVYLNAFTAGTGQSINLLTFSVFNTILCIAVILLYVLVCKYILRVDMSMLTDVKSLADSSRKVTFREKFSMAAVMLLMLSIFIPNITPAGTFFNRLGTGGIIALLTVFLAIIRIDGEPVLNFQKVARFFNFDVYFLICLILPLIPAVTSDATGIKTFLIQNIMSTASGMSTIIFVIFIVIAGIIVTNFANNMVVGALVISLAAILGQAMPGLNMAALAVILMFACSCSLFFPAASPINAICFGQNDIVTFGQEFKVSIVATICIALFLIAVAYPLAMVLF